MMKSKPYNDFEFEGATTISQLREHIIKEIQIYHPQSSLLFLEKN